MADKDLKEIIREAAEEPQSATVDGQTIQQRPLSDLIAAAKFTAGSNAAARPGAGIRIHKPMGNSAV
ncbi:hypothetical protein [Victivallis vadensis]|uniref:hypothetical protein n=1 Tax=Victivallis vadensis TaxID=172901 RepID=UPI0023F67C2F|nr:hypothetical protein [Victivallis vadensis]